MLSLMDTFSGRRMVCSKNGFLGLRTLSITESQLEEWSVEQGSMPSLLKLTIIGCQKLKEYPDGLRHISSLVELCTGRFGKGEWEQKLAPGGEHHYRVQHIGLIRFMVKFQSDQVGNITTESERQTEICRHSLEHLKLDVNTKDENGDTPLVQAARQGEIETAEDLLQHGADPNIAGELGATALHHAAGAGEIELLKELLSRGVLVDSQSEPGTPLVWAASRGQEDAVQVLLEHNADPNIETEDGSTPLLFAVAAGSLPCLELLIKAGARANVFARGGATPLHIAADIGSLELINCLLKAEADPNQKDKEGNRPLEVAALRENRKVVEILFPLTTKPETVSDWSVDGILAHPESNKELEQEGNSNRAKSGEAGIKKDLPEVSPEAKAKAEAAEAKARGQDAFHRKDFQMAIDAYTQAIAFDPTDHTLFSNRSLCWLRLGQAEHALSDAKTCRELKPDWPKGCFREGAALRLLQRQRFDEAAKSSLIRKPFSSYKS